MSSLDPAQRAQLEEERDFLLASLDDLELELAAGDVDQADYDALESDYTTRAARVIRRLADDETAVGTAAQPRSARRTLAWVGGVVVVAAVAGLLLARFSGSRSSGDTITGDIRTTSRELLFDAQQAFAEGDSELALALYDEAIEIQPSNAEALSYRGWLLSRTGDPEAAVIDLDDAIAIEPGYPDARVFRAVVALDLGDPDTAEAQLAVFDSLEPPAFAERLVAEARLRERIALVRVTEVLLVDDPPPFDETGLEVADVADAAEVLAADGELLQAVQLFDSVLADDPDNVEGLTYRGWLLARAGDDRLLEGAIEQLGRALVIDPAYPYALVFRAFALSQAGDLAAAGADLDAFDSLAIRPEELIALIEQFGLREALAAG